MILPGCRRIARKLAVKCCSGKRLAPDFSRCMGGYGTKLGTPLACCWRRGATSSNCARPYPAAPGGLSSPPRRAPAALRWCKIIRRARVTLACAADATLPSLHLLDRDSLAAVPVEPGHAARRHAARSDYVLRKFGGEERARRLYTSISAVGQAEGLQFRFERIRRTPSSVDAHRLVARAAAQGRAAGSSGGAVRGAFHRRARHR